MKPYGWAGLLLLLVSEYCLFRKVEPFGTWFYCFAWWSYILLADNLLLRLRGRSLLCGRRAELWRMLPLSVFTWLLFEAYNLILHNWAYRDVIAQTWLRWLGYSIAFATVLPGVFITADLCEYMLFRVRERPFASENEQVQGLPHAVPANAYVILGACMSIAPLLWPRFFFPAVWIGPIFLLDPLLGRLGLRSLSAQITAGSRRRVCSLLAGGLACGLLWEFWNFWATSRWVYTIPFFGEWKVFEMPVLGFLGFPPFALECWIFYHLSTGILGKWSPWPARAAFWIGILAFCLLMFRAIDIHTVLNFAADFHQVG